VVGLTSSDFRVGLVLLFLDSMLVPAFRGWCGCGWVEHRVWFMVFRISVRGFGTLLGPEETPFWCLLSSRSGSSNALLVGVVVVGSIGVWLCVECCIVDASILL
jgi:hypothetical protein